MKKISLCLEPGSQSPQAWGRRVWLPQDQATSGPLSLGGRVSVLQKESCSALKPGVGSGPHARCRLGGRWPFADTVLTAGVAL